MPEFGKHCKGVFHPWVLNQDKVWVNIDGDEYTIDEMDIVYLENVQNFLLRRTRRTRMIGKSKFRTADLAEEKLRSKPLFVKLDMELVLRTAGTNEYEID